MLLRAWRILGSRVVVPRVILSCSLRAREFVHLPERIESAACGLLQRYYVVAAIRGVGANDDVEVSVAMQVIVLSRTFAHGA